MQHQQQHEHKDRGYGHLPLLPPTSVYAAAVGMMMSTAASAFYVNKPPNLPLASLRGSGSSHILHTAAPSMATYLGQCLTLGQLHTLAGAAASFVALISSYPLDLMKNRVASASLYKSPLDCMRITWKNEGFRGFYKGVSSPMIGDVAIGMTAFGVYGYMSTWLKQREGHSLGPAKTAAISGGTAGLAAAVIGCPFEVVKLQLQMQYVRGLSASINVASSQYTSVVNHAVAIRRAEHLGTVYGGLIDCTKQVVGSRAYNMGLTAMCMRNVVGWSMSYPTFEYSRSRFAEYMYGDCSEKYIAKLPTWSLMLSGGISGSIFWAAVFPMDVIKANMQGQKINERTWACVRNCVGDLYKAGGLGRFYKGLSAAILRAFPHNAVAYSVYALVVTALTAPQPSATE
ncbi:conserved hypothetical protein [Perkinsus marinus ATCC 50983]|uniref:Mitochondrial carrier protein n=1 Tax=Perkinsus marinus (strain ATCC 50983 / TXsc) TaxID=423536 RepID=C5KPU9_PERM5|nr:conserved hypothetical protein [Perkinsus marinus ATCC 50983]EER13496.1 conserved hypothetical protein [Perkinsus marinus ATCC 50983]|eukprot:XP_002781701.1 conserved hypothetical protein [Perkinsus marinus ATCC 50983]